MKKTQQKSQTERILALYIESYITTVFQFIYKSKNALGLRVTSHHDAQEVISYVRLMNITSRDCDGGDGRICSGI
jgi:hypothetical protein